MMLDGMLQRAAGTDMERHISFLAEADAYGVISRRLQRSCPQCPGGLSFTRYDDVPIFQPNVDLTAGVRWSVWTCLYLAAAVAVLSLLARHPT
jgi:ABC-2 type transport system permease protein